MGRRKHYINRDPTADAGVRNADRALGSGADRAPLPLGQALVLAQRAKRRGDEAGYAIFCGMVSQAMRDDPENPDRVRRSSRER